MWIPDTVEGNGMRFATRNGVAMRYGVAMMLNRTISIVGAASGRGAGNTAVKPAPKPCAARPCHTSVARRARPDLGGDYRRRADRGRHCCATSARPVSARVRTIIERGAFRWYWAAIIRAQSAPERTRSGLQAARCAGLDLIDAHWTPHAHHNAERCAAWHAARRLLGQARPWSR
jgi:hypothetical protein